MVVPGDGFAVGPFVGTTPLPSQFILIEPV